MLRRLQVQTAGESHGRGVIATMTGIPAGVPWDEAHVQSCLARRQAGYGRSSRQTIETDRAEVLAGLYRGRTSGAPLVLAVWNADQSLPDRDALVRPRPGHADLAGGCKYGDIDMRPVLERASARETAARVAAGAVASALLLRLGVDVLGRTVALGGLWAARPGPRTGLPGLRKRVLRSPFACADRALEADLIAAVDAARKAGDTLGGVVEVLATGAPPGLGSLDGFGTRLDARLGAALFSIQAIKAVELGDGLEAAERWGSAVHDAVLEPNEAGPRRATNRAGGVEGGMSNGEPVVVRAFMKPLSMMRSPSRSWDFAERRPVLAHYERSDVTAVPAASVVAEAMVALVLLDALLERTGGDTLSQVDRSLRALRRDVGRAFGRRP